MRIAILNAFPNTRVTAEREFIQRLLPVLTAQGHHAIEVAISDEIEAFDPDCVIVTSELVAKLTRHFTVGLLWNPLSIYANNEMRLRSIRSWDFVIPINNVTRQFARDIRFPAKRSDTVSDLDFYPSSPVGDHALPDHSKLSLAYMGVHWDGERHRPLLEALARRLDLNVYGPPEVWGFMGKHYRGEIPVDGVSVIKTLNSHGAVLALHKDTHIEGNTPSMRVFEGCAARCLVMTERLPALARKFGDGLSYIDVKQSPDMLAAQIAGHLEAHRADGDMFAAQVQRASSRFQENASLDRLASRMVQEIAAQIERRSRDVTSGPAITVIMRCGARPLSFLKRAVASLAAQSYRDIGILFVRFGEIEGFEDWRRGLAEEGRFLFTDEVICVAGNRSLSMWAGLRAVKTDFFCMLDDDDEVFPDHLAELAATLADKPESGLAYSGAIVKIETDERIPVVGRLMGAMGKDIKERRALAFLADFDLDRLFRMNNYIISNAWLAMRSTLTSDVLEDPELEVNEDFYFLLLLASRYQFAFSGTPSAVWNWRKGDSENSTTMVSRDTWIRCQQRVMRRLGRITYPGGYLGRDVFGPKKGLPVKEAVTLPPARPHAVSKAN